MVDDLYPRLIGRVGVHAPAGLGFTFCGLKASKRRGAQLIEMSGDEDEVTCPRCREALGGTDFLSTADIGRP
ncbi:MAG TPA: hypothetical protein VGG29_03480 [Caulobacteraceae bacterium]